MLQCDVAALVVVKAVTCLYAGMLVTMLSRCLTLHVGRRDVRYHGWFLGGAADAVCRHVVDIPDALQTLRKPPIFSQVQCWVRFLTCPLWVTGTGDGPDSAGNCLEVVDVPVFLQRRRSSSCPS